MDHVRRPRRRCVGAVVTARAPPGPARAPSYRVCRPCRPENRLSARVPPALHRFSPRFFVVFLGLTVWAFWPSYFARLFEQPTVLHHAHGVVLAAWLVMLVTQAHLIRTQRRSLHRQIGKLSYVLAPA